MVVYMDPLGINTLNPKPYNPKPKNPKPYLDPLGLVVPSQREWYAKLRDLGLDLLVTGHIHEQLWAETGVHIGAVIFNCTLGFLRVYSYCTTPKFSIQAIKARLLELGFGVWG